MLGQMPSLQNDYTINRRQSLYEWLDKWLWPQSKQMQSHASNLQIHFILYSIFKVCLLGATGATPGADSGLEKGLIPKNMSSIMCEWSKYTNYSTYYGNNHLPYSITLSSTKRDTYICLISNPNNKNTNINVVFTSTKEIN
jgi:hypothetical protein